MKRQIMVGAIVLLGLISFFPAGAAPANPLPPLKMQGVTLVRNDGTRFVVGGLNMEMYRDYDGGCGWASDGAWDIRVIMAQKIKDLNVNIVRLNYSYRFLNTAQNFNRFMDMAEALANQNIYVMPSDHTYTGASLSGASASYPMMKKIIDNATARGIANYVVMNAFNEPYNNTSDSTVSAWVQAQKDVLTYLRNTAGFTGVIALDGAAWSTLLDVNAFKGLMTFDAGLRGGTPNIMFSNHLYPNIQGLPAQIWTAANQVPLVVGELGQENPGASPLDPQYVKTVIAGYLNAGYANGHNGLFAWIWNWCDSNELLHNWELNNIPYTGASTLTDHGILWRDNYYAKLPGAVVPPPSTVIVQQPTSTRTPSPTRTNTPRPPTRTATPPVLIITNTPQPSTPCDATTEIVGQLNGKQAVFTTCIRYLQ